MRLSKYKHLNITYNSVGWLIAGPLDNQKEEYFNEKQGSCVIIKNE